MFMNLITNRSLLSNCLICAQNFCKRNGKFKEEQFNSKSKITAQIRFKAD